MNDGFHNKDSHFWQENEKPEGEAKCHEMLFSGRTTAVARMNLEQLQLPVQD